MYSILYVLRAAFIIAFLSLNYFVIGYPTDERILYAILSIIGLCSSMILFTRERFAKNSFTTIISYLSIQLAVASFIFAFLTKSPLWLGGIILGLGTLFGIEGKTVVESNIPKYEGTKSYIHLKYYYFRPGRRIAGAYLALNPYLGILWFSGMSFLGFKMYQENSYFLAIASFLLGLLAIYNYFSMKRFLKKHDETLDSIAEKIQEATPKSMRKK